MSQTLMRKCPKFFDCSVPICPLNKEGIRLGGEDKCGLSVKKRRKLRRLSE